MNFISSEAIIENAKYKRDSEIKMDKNMQTIPYKNLVADNFEQTMKKYLSNSNNGHYSSAYSEDLHLNVGNEHSEHSEHSEQDQINQPKKEFYPNIKGINTGGKEWKSTTGQYETSKIEIPDNNCGKKFNELLKTDNAKTEKGISYPILKNSLTEHFTTKEFLESQKIKIICIVIIIVLGCIILKLYLKNYKLKQKNKLLKIQLQTFKQQYY